MNDSNLVDVDQIIVGERDRSEMGDIVGLAESIDEVGLLHPVVVTEAFELVAGGRRLEAVKQLGWLEVPVTIVMLSNAEEVLAAEMDENVQRKGLTPYEAAKARHRRSELLAPVAAENVGGRPRKNSETSSKLDEVSTPATAKATRKVAAKGTGYSGSTLDKVDKIRDAAERGVIKQGKKEVSAPAPVIEVAERSLAGVQQTGAAVDRAYRLLEEAVDAYVGTDPDVQRAKFRQLVHAKVGGVIDVLELTEPKEVAAVLELREWDDFEGYFTQAVKWWEQVKSHRTRSLKIVGEQ